MLNELDGVQSREDRVTTVGSSKELLQLSRASREEVFKQLEKHNACRFKGVDFSLFRGNIDEEFVRTLLTFLDALPPGGNLLRMSHIDLGSGTNCEQRIFELVSEKKVRESEKAFHEKKKLDSSKQKEFAAAAQMKRKAQEGIDATVARLADINKDLTGLEQEKMVTSWYRLFIGLEALSMNTVQHLDLSNCGLHATGLVLLTNVLLELDNRADGEKISWLALDGNDLGDQAMGCIASFLRLSRVLQALQLRNVGVTEIGVSEIVAGLVGNKTLALLDLRANNLCNSEAALAAVKGVQHFNRTAQILLA